ncbi:MAG: squalene--hopene cyclase [Acidobacteria bacterium]|nr:squalene--hopene cyclase [Acidobacteriota bacterium]
MAELQLTGSGSPSPAPSPGGVVESENHLDQAIAAAQRYLLSIQAEDGHWCGELEGDTILESEYVMLMYFLGRAHEEKVWKAASFLRGKQAGHGGWSVYPGGPVDVSASTKAYFALKLLGDNPNEPHMERARRAILAKGGLEACNSFTKIYLAIFCQYPWEKCPSVPPELILFPRKFYLNIYQMSSWSRAILVPLSIISARRPKCPVPPQASIQDLISDRPPKPKRSAWTSFFYAVDAVVKRLEQLPYGKLREIALERAERWTLERLESSDGLGAIFPPIVNTIYALCARGYAPAHPAVQAQVRQLERLEIEEETTLRLQPCFSPVWDTAYALNAMVGSGLPPDSPSVVKAARWLLDRRGDHRGDWAVTKDKGHDKRVPAGWYFEYANPFYPDCDTTAQVLTSLSKVEMPRATEHSRCQRAIYEGHEWHLGMQNADGGWAAFDRGCDKEILTKVPFADHNAMIDPSTADLTARGLEAMAEIGFGADYPPARRAIRFMKRHQEPDGAWFGRWGCNYLYGTYLALWGLSRIGLKPGDGAVRRGAAWLKSVQNADGGWGESLASYENPSERGKGPSTPSQTAWAVLGLIAAGERDAESVRRGVRFLLARQAENGAWPEEEWTGTGFPRVFYLRYHLYPVYFPLLALGEFARHEPRHRRARAESTERKHLHLVHTGDHAR